LIDATWICHRERESHRAVYRLVRAGSVGLKGYGLRLGSQSVRYAKNA
jgi:hypothetical protein